MPEITTDEERVQVSAYQNSVNLIGSAVGSGFVIIMSGFIADSPIGIIYGYLSSSPQQVTQSVLTNGVPTGIYGPAGTTLLIFAIAFAIVEILVFLPALLRIKEKRIVHKEKRKIFAELKIAFKNRNYMIWVGSFTILNIGVTIMTALLIDFLEKVVGVESAIQKTVFGAIMFLIIIVSFVFWSRFSKRFGKKWSLILSFTFLLIWMPLTPLVGAIPGIPAIVQGYLFSGVAMFGLASAYLFPYAILADFADADERKTQENRSGLYTGFKSLPFNIAQATGFLLAGLIRKWPDGLRWLGTIVAPFLLLAIPIIWQGDFDPFLKDESVKKTSIFLQIYNNYKQLFNNKNNDDKKD
jgi:Na+/melibiose symporter-like transporter